jgi:predicted house-cleaning noncanonical NTP pyrophosphatase (MazG superfamily)
MDLKDLIEEVSEVVEDSQEVEVALVVEVIRNLHQTIILIKQTDVSILFLKIKFFLV